MEFAPLVILPLFVIKLMDFLRYAKARDWNGVLSQLIVWAAGVIAVLFLAHSAWGDQFPIGDYPLGRLGTISQIFVGMNIASVSSVIKDFFKAQDNSNSAAIPTLLPAGPQKSAPNAGGVAATDVG